MLSLRAGDGPGDGSLPLMGEMWVASLAPGSGLAQSVLLQLLGVYKPTDGKSVFFLNPAPLLSLCLSNKHLRILL